MDYSNMDPDAMSTTSSINSNVAEELSGIYSASKPLLWVSKALGVLPAQASRVSHVVAQPSQPYQPTRSSRIYSALLYLTVMTLGGLNIYYRILAMVALLEMKQGEKNTEPSSSSDNVMLYVKLAYTLLTALFCLLYVLFNRLSGESFANVFASIDSVDESLRFMDFTSASKRSIRHILFAALVLPLAISDVYMLSSEFVLTDSSTWAYVGFIMHFVSLLTNVIVEQQFISFCLALRERFEHLNLHLISLQPLVFPIQEIDLKLKNSEMSLNDHFYAVARSEFADLAKYSKQDRGILRARGVSPLSYVKSAWGADATGSPISPRPFINIPEGPVTLKSRLALLRRVHDSLCDIMGQVNGMYGACLLASISFIFCGVLSLSYYVVTKALYPQLGGGTDVIVALVQAITWLLYLSARLIALTWACASTTREVCACNNVTFDDRPRIQFTPIVMLSLGYLTIFHAQRAGPLHQKLTKRTLDSSTKEELHLFSTQLLQRDIGFSVCGLFPLDFTLLYTVAGAVTTYLVILIQFQSVQPPPKPNVTSTAAPYLASANITTPIR